MNDKRFAAVLTLALALHIAPARAAYVSSEDPAVSILELVTPSPIVFPGSASSESPPSGSHVPFAGSAFAAPFVAGLFYAATGCDAADFTGFTTGYIALIARGNCLFQKKALLSEAAGAAGMIVYDTGTNFLGGNICPSTPCAQMLPSIFATQEVGAALLGAFRSGQATIRMGVVAAVPEPATPAVLAIGLLGLIVVRRRATR